MIKLTSEFYERPNNYHTRIKITPPVESISLCLKTLVVDGNEDDTVFEGPHDTFGEDKVLIINRPIIRNNVYNQIKEGLSNGWDGTYLYVVLNRRDKDINTELIRNLEDGILIHATLPPLVWNSQVVIVVTCYPDVHYKLLIGDYERKLSPRSTRLMLT